MEESYAGSEKNVEINYAYEYLPSSVKNLHPLLSHHGNSYRCALAADQQTSIIGYGETPEAALYTWDKLWQEQHVNVPGIEA